MNATIELPEPGTPFTSKLLLLAALHEADKGNCAVEVKLESGDWRLMQDLKTEEKFLSHNRIYRIQPPPPFQYKAAATLPESGISDMEDMIVWLKKQYRIVHEKSHNKTLACKVEITFNEVVETPKPKPKQPVRK